MLIPVLGSPKVSNKLLGLSNVRRLFFKHQSAKFCASSLSCFVIIRDQPHYSCIIRKLHYGIGVEGVQDGTQHVPLWCASASGGLIGPQSHYL